MNGSNNSRIMHWDHEPWKVSKAGGNPALQTLARNSGVLEEQTSRFMEGLLMPGCMYWTMNLRSGTAFGVLYFRGTTGGLRYRCDLPRKRSGFRLLSTNPSG